MVLEAELAWDINDRTSGKLEKVAPHVVGTSFGEEMMNVWSVVGPRDRCVELGIGVDHIDILVASKIILVKSFFASLFLTRIFFHFFSIFLLKTLAELKIVQILD